VDSLKDQVVVITGGASGIGLAIARAAAALGARPVVADIDGAALAAVRDDRDLPDGTLVVHTDVADAASVEALRDAVLEQHGRVDVLCNNAGVSTFNLIENQTLADWRWVLDVNLWGVIHGIAAFLPVMQQQGTPAHIVNTSSVAGLASGVPFLGPYAASKVAVVSISETLQRELSLSGSPIGVSVLCPSATDTNIMEAERNRPAALAPEARTADAEAWRLGIKASFTGPTGLTAEAVAGRVIDAVLQNRFWVITHDDLTPMIADRFAEILRNTPNGEAGQRPGA
jgi:NAD(P)-dependent dehydrogenase (short-subunit alcohol dehydrogenase family)